MYTTYNFYSVPNKFISQLFVGMVLLVSNNNLHTIDIAR